MLNRSEQFTSDERGFLPAQKPTWCRQAVDSLKPWRFRPAWRRPTSGKQVPSMLRKTRVDARHRRHAYWSMVIFGRVKEKTSRMKLDGLARRRVVFGPWSSWLQEVRGLSVVLRINRTKPSLSSSWAAWRNLLISSVADRIWQAALEAPAVIDTHAKSCCRNSTKQSSPCNFRIPSLKRTKACEDMARIDASQGWAFVEVWACLWNSSLPQKASFQNQNHWDTKRVE